MDLSEGVQYFTKNIVIQPVPIEHKNETQIYTYERVDKKEKEIGTFGKDIDKHIKKVRTHEKKSWESQSSSGEEALVGIRSSGQTAFSEDLLKGVDIRTMDIDENTKFFNKTITIKPVFIPPLKFDK